MLASPAATTFSQLKVDDGLFCKDLCKYDLSGPGCNVDCTGIKPEVFDVTPDFCDILCKRGLGKCWVKLIWKLLAITYKKLI